MQTLNPGIYEEISREQYDSWDAFNQSGVKHILRSPKHYMHWLMNGDDGSESKRLGSLIDCLLLTPHLFDKSYAIVPETYKDSKGVVKAFTKQSNTCKKILEQIEESGKTPVTKADTDKAQAIAQSVLAHRSAAEIIDGSKKQVGLVWIDSDYGVLCKALLDLLSDVAISDLKSTRDAGPGFPKSVNNFGYHIQGAFYSDGYAALTKNVQLPYQFIAVETDEPYCVATYALEPDSILTGRHIYKKALKLYKECKEQNRWPGYSDFLEPLEIPAWAISRVLEEGVINGFTDAF